jgi:hypothetical protein
MSRDRDKGQGKRPVLPLTVSNFSNVGFLIAAGAVVDALGLILLSDSLLVPRLVGAPGRLRKNRDGWNLSGGG